MATFSITVQQRFTVNVLFAALNVPSGETALHAARTINGITDGAGTDNRTSSETDTNDVALPSTPAASTYSTSTGTVTVACTLAHWAIALPIDVQIADNRIRRSGTGTDERKRICRILRREIRKRKRIVFELQLFDARIENFLLPADTLFPSVRSADFP